MKKPSSRREKTFKNSPPSYFHAQESGFYYLNSRYYDPQVGRFINADTFASTGQGLVGNNMSRYYDPEIGGTVGQGTVLCPAFS